MFQGFNFDDDGFGRRGDFRSHLDDLASRHPEFADHLLWDDIPFRGSLRNRRRGSGSGNNYQDEDAKSQASGSSAASGASAVSSHGEPEIRQEPQEPRRKPIPQYGLRNTVDIGQHQMNMENPEKVNRNQRSMSAPPENRQAQQQEPQQRFVSRVEITPQQQQQQQQQQQEQPQSEKSPGPQPQQTPQQKTQQQGNVRHIPIFVEGRDKPVIPKNVDDVPFPGQSPPPPQFQAPPQYQQPPQYQTPPQFQPPPPTFHRPSHFNERFGRQNWPSQFEEAFFDQPRWSREGPERPERQFKKDWTHGQQPHPQQEKHPQYQQQQHPQYQQPHPQHKQQPQYQQQHPPYQQEKQQPQQPPQQKQEPETPKPKQTLPKDPLERVALVQKEVDSLNEQVKNYKGTSRKDKEYIYLDEMLTRELIKLDDIETEGKENVRQSRKNAIKSIQDSINLLESMVPLPGQQKPQPQEFENQPEESQSEETMETEVPEDTHDKPIPLPPGPCCLFPKEENSITLMEQNQESGQETGKPEVESSALVETQKAEAEVVTENADAREVAKVEETSQIPINCNPEAKSPVTMEVQEAEKVENQNQVQVDGFQEGQQPKAAKSTKKVKKTKKQPAPVSAEAIPLPPPKSNQKGTK